jgi:hypothetical protein
LFSTVDVDTANEIEVGDAGEPNVETVSVPDMEAAAVAEPKKFTLVIQEAPPASVWVTLPSVTEQLVVPTIAALPTAEKASNARKTPAKRFIAPSLPK